jgi:hypothetical protein
MSSPTQQVEPHAAAAAPSDFHSKGTDITHDSEDGAELLLYFRTITTAVPTTDILGEEYLDLSGCGAMNDGNLVEPIESRRELWDTGGSHPELKGRLVIFDFARPLLAEIKAAFGRGTKTVLVTGTPGIGKSALRNVHAHLLLSDALARQERCCIIFAKGGSKSNMLRLHLEANGTYHIELIETGSVWVQLGFKPFKRGTDLFVLADVSDGNVDSLSSGGLILYSSPNDRLTNQQMMKQSAVRLGYAVLSKV